MISRAYDVSQFTADADAEIQVSADAHYTYLHTYHSVFMADLWVYPNLRFVLTGEDLVASDQVNISSMDYGGTAKLRAWFIDPASGLEFSAEVLKPDGTTTTFASLPIDENGNGIADGWEQQYGGNLSPSADTDQSGVSTVGDGLTVFEEYRGLHYLNRGSGGSSIAWTSTNPIETLDLFIWDHPGLFYGDLDFFRQQFPFITLREVDEQTAELVSDEALEEGVKRLNANSSSSYNVFPILLLNWGLGGNCDPSQGSVRAILGEAPDDAKAYGPDGRPVKLDNANLNACGSLFGFPQSAWRQVLLAHEIGHNLGLTHPTEYRGYTAINYTADISLLQNLSLDKYTYEPSPNTELYTWLEDYYYPVAGLTDIRQAQGVAAKVGLLGANQVVSVAEMLFAVFGSPRRSIYRNVFQVPISAQNVVVVQQSLFNGSQANVMNWTPRLEDGYHTTAAWSFSGADIQSSYVRRKPN